MNRKGMSVIEVLIGISIFSIAAMTATSMLFEVVKMEKKSSIENSLQEDARLILQALTNEIQNGTIDYEEYFSINVVQYDSDLIFPKPKYYGINYGVYGSRFYDPGKSLDGAATSNPADLGVECSYRNPDTNECEVTYVLSADLNTGKNPFTGNVNDADSLFEGGKGRPTGPEKAVLNELYLLDSTGTKKTIIARKKTSAVGDYVVGLIRMVGQDIDQNGVIDTFSCAPEFAETCVALSPSFPSYPWFNSSIVNSYGLTVPSSEDLDNALDPNSTQFIPFTPVSINISELKFIISPIEDPYKAYAEEGMQMHPSVTIILTATLAESAKADYPGEFTPITVQTTVTAGVLGGIPSYPPTNNVSWMSNLGLTSRP